VASDEGGDTQRRGAREPVQNGTAARDQKVSRVGSSPGEERDEAAPGGYRAVLASRAFFRLWLAQICSQLAQNTVFASMLAQIQYLTRSSTNVVFVIASGLLPQVLLSGLAGVLVDRSSKRAVLLCSNVARLGCVAAYLSMQNAVGALFAIVFLSQAIGQFFAPAEAAAIPILVRRADLMAATSLFNISFNIAQVIPFGLGLLLLSFIGLSRLLILVAVLFAVAAFLVSTLPAAVATRPRRRENEPTIRQVTRHLWDEAVEGVRFIAQHGALRLALVQINITPTILFLFGVLGVDYVQRVIHLRPDNLYILLVPAGIGLIGGAWALGQFGARFRKERLVQGGLFLLALAVMAMGALPPLIAALHAGHLAIPSQPYNALTYPAMAIALLVGVAMALTTVPTQTIVFEHAAPAMRGRVLAMQQWLGGAVPLVPLLLIGPLVDIIGVTTVLIFTGALIVLAGCYSIQADAQHRRAQARVRRVVEPEASLPH
jgi:MFS family permease